MGLLLVALGLGCNFALAQPAQRIAYFSLLPPTDNFKSFQRRITELGYREGGNLQIDYWISGADQALLEKHALAITQSGPHLILAVAPNASVAAKNATRSIPIIFISGSDPVGLGLVKSLARPGENVTGFANMPADLVAKRLEILKEFVHGLKRVAIMTRDGNPNHANHRDRWAGMARALGLEPVLVSISGPEQIEAAFASAARQQAGAVCLIQDSVLFQSRKRIADAALRHHLPTVADSREYVASGVLVSYGADYARMWYRVAEYAVRILRGESPGELPVQQPADIESLVNKSTADALRLKIPASVLQFAGEVVK